MELPKDSDQLVNFARELIEECLHSRDQRRALSRDFQTLFYMGSTSGTASKYNKCYTHVDKLSSYIFSAADVRFALEFEGCALPQWQEKTKAAARHVNKQFNKGDLGGAFAMANQISLVEGASIAKLTWKNGGLRGWPIRPVFFGVQREDLNGLDDQECFVHSYFVTEAAFKRLIINHPDRAELMAKVSMINGPAADMEIAGGSYFREILAGGISPISYEGSPALPYRGSVQITAPPLPNLPPEVTARLIQIDDLWIWNDNAKWSDQHGEHTGDWTTIRYVQPGLIIEGKYQRRNLSDIPGQHPFVKVCSNEVPGYFWGRSEMAQLAQPQAQLTDRTQDIDSIWRLRAKPPRAFLGVQGISDEKALALLAPGGHFADAAIGSKIENLAPELPPEALPLLSVWSDILDEVGGFTKILSGEGESGVRAGVHAGTLLRTSTPRLRERALTVEKQCSAFATKALKMAAAKSATVIEPRGDAKQAFLLSTLPCDVSVSVDSHTSSPAFVDDNRQLAVMLAKAEAIDGESLIEMTHPQNEDFLVEKYRQRQEAAAKAAAANPVAAAEAAKDAKK